MGEVYAISLAQTIGAYSLVTDDIKQGGPYMSLLQFEEEVMPFTFADILILRYLLGTVDAAQTVKDFSVINDVSFLNWSFKSQIKKFIKRFLTNPYREDDTRWLKELAKNNEINIKGKLTILSKLVK